MIGNTSEYFQANNLILDIMEMINKHPIFDEIKPIQSSDIVNLSLDILRTFIRIHSGESGSVDGDIRMLGDIVESSNNFVRFADISIDCQRSNNNNLIKVLSAFEDVEDVDEVISRILVYGKRLKYE